MYSDCPPSADMYSKVMFQNVSILVRCISLVSGLQLQSMLTPGLAQMMIPTVRNRISIIYRRHLMHYSTTTQQITKPDNFLS